LILPAERYCPLQKDKSWLRIKEDTLDYHKFWNEQIKYCLDGYKPYGGQWIPGNYYFYLNFCKIIGYDEKTNRKGMVSPKYRDQDHEYFLALDKAKKDGYGIIVLKARRKGFSFMNANILLHEWTFYSNSENGIGAQHSNYVEDFRKKLILTYSTLPKELRLKTLRQDDDILMSGYKEKVDGAWVEKGRKSMIHFRTMDKPDAFRGTSLTWMVFEEAGEFKELKKAFIANEECFREGAIQFGVPIIGGTSNQLGNESQDYMEMYYNAERYNLKPLFIPASKVYYPFFDDKTGISDVEGATADIEKRREAKQKSGDKSSYYGFLQEMPLKPEDAFLGNNKTPFDIDKINEQKANILTNTNLQIVKKGRLEWGKNINGKRQFGNRPEFIEDVNGPIQIAGDPLTMFKNAYVSGVDPYHVDDVLDEKKIKRESKGCMIVFQKYINTEIPGEMPVAMYCDRPYSKEEFYENCLKLAIYYDSPILVEYNDDGFLKYFIDNKMIKYLKERPRSADSPWSNVSNRYGINMKSYQKTLAIDLIDDYIKKNVEQIYFVELLTELADFGTKNTDRVMAFGISLIHNGDNVKIVQNALDEIVELHIPHFKREHGRLSPVHNFDKNILSSRKNISTFGFNFDN
jgi:hypothetical protein